MLDLMRQTLGTSGKVVLMVTHDPSDARRVADQVIFLASGVASPPVDTARLFADPPPELKNYLGEVD